jgi:hypothetical protein
MKAPDCHPERKHAGHGLCHPCYEKRRSITLGDTEVSRRRRDALYFWKYKIRLDQYEKMLAQQAGKCAICLKPPKNRRLAVDHDHHTGRVRGLLCWWCNKRIVTRRITPADLRRAADYLESVFDGRAI